MTTTKKAKALTDLVIRRAPLKPAAYQLQDSQVPGLYVRVFPTGAKSFGFVWRAPNGKQIRRSLGTYPAMGLVEARSAAHDLRRDGAKPVSVTFEEACRRYMDLHAARKNRESTLIEKRRLLAGFIDRWKALPVEEIRKADVVRVLDEIAESSGPSEADHAMSVVRAVFYWLEGRGEIERCPASRLPRYSDRTPKDRVLSETELRAVWHAASEMHDGFGEVVKLIILTAQRPGEVGGQTWAEVLGTEWHLPSSRAKNRLPCITPLVVSAHALLEEIRLHQIASGTPSPVVFPNRSLKNEDRSMRLTSERRHRLRRLADQAFGAPLQPWSLHDLRRTVRTGLSRLGVNADVAERVLHHVPSTLVRTYDRHDFVAEKRAALVQWEAYVLRIVE